MQNILTVDRFFFVSFQAKRLVLQHRRRRNAQQQQQKQQHWLLRARARKYKIIVSRICPFKIAYIRDDDALRAAAQFFCEPFFAVQPRAREILGHKNQSFALRRWFLPIKRGYFCKNTIDVWFLCEPIFFLKEYNNKKYRDEKSFVSYRIIFVRVRSLSSRRRSYSWILCLFVSKK